MKSVTTLIIIVFSVLGSRLHSQEPQVAGTQEQQSATADAPRGQPSIRVLEERSQRGTLHDAFQNVRGDSGKWNDEPIWQHAPPIGHKPANVSLDDWADQLLEQEWKLAPGDENWLLLRTRQLDDNDRVWIHRIERRGNQITMVVHEAIWQGKYSKTFTYYSAFGIDLGKLEPGRYQAKCVIMPQVFKQFDGDKRPTGNWPADELPADKAPVELNLSFSVAAETR